MHPAHSRTPRRQFLQTVAFTTAFSNLLGRSWSNVVAGEIALHSAATTGTLRVRLENYPALQSEFGSVRLAINPINGNVGPSGTFYPVIINRDANNAFFAVNSRCTHQGCVVDPLDPGSARMTCPCHGSVFGIDGRRLAGLAPSNLTRYTLANDTSTGTLAIQIPSLGYSVTATPAAPADSGKARVRLDFRSFRNVEYEVQFRPALDQPPVAVPFATTANGVADQTSFRAPSATNLSFYVEQDAPAGFLTVAVRVEEI